MKTSIIPQALQVAMNRLDEAYLEVKRQFAALDQEPVPNISPSALVAHPTLQDDKAFSAFFDKQYKSFAAGTDPLHELGSAINSGFVGIPDDWGVQLSGTTLIDMDYAVFDFKNESEFYPSEAYLGQRYILLAPRIKGHTDPAFNQLREAVARSVALDAFEETVDYADFDYRIPSAWTNRTGQTVFFLLQDGNLHTSVEGHQLPGWYADEDYLTVTFKHGEYLDITVVPMKQLPKEMTMDFVLAIAKKAYIASTNLAGELTVETFPLKEFETKMAKYAPSTTIEDRMIKADDFYFSVRRMEPITTQ